MAVFTNKFGTCQCIGYTVLEYTGGAFTSSTVSYKLTKLFLHYNGLIGKRISKRIEIAGMDVQG